MSAAAEAEFPEPASTFAELAASRRLWIDEVLRPWCTTATVSQLRLAELEWLDIAGRADTQSTLWTWAWSRFPDIVHGELSGINETHRVKVVTASGEVLSGYPDGRKSERGKLFLLGNNIDGDLVHLPEVSLDDITEIRRCSDQQEDEVSVSS